jgi:diguanylate cyclase (GGDEF)-like protein
LLAKTTGDLIHPEDQAAQAARMQSIINHDQIPPATEAKFLKFDGSVIDVQVQGTAIDFDGEPAIHVSIHDITERKRLEHEIRQLAFYDELTKLPNRRLLDDRLQQVLSSSKRHGHFSALMFLDLDNFKALNDRHGHAMGDALLIDAAARLRKCVREMDTVARFGGDEFVVLIPELGNSQSDSTTTAMGIADKIRATLSEPYVLEATQVDRAGFSVTHQCTVSLGVLIFSDDASPVDDLLKWADAAMYQAKDEGRNRIRLYNKGP